MRKKVLSFLYGLGLLLFLWQIIHLLSPNHFFPSPIETFLNCLRLFSDPELPIHVLASCLRLLAAILLSLLIGTGLGLLMGVHPMADRILGPIVYILYPIPKVAFLPVLFIFFGLGELVKILLILLIVVFQIAIMVRDTVKAVPEGVFLQAKLLGLEGIERLRHILLPCILKAVLSSTRVSVGTGIAILFFAENYATRYGLGYFIMNSWSLINYLDMFSGIVFLSLLGVIFFGIIDWLEARYCRWSF